MSKTYLPYDPDQQSLLPQALQEWLPEDHLAYFISDIVSKVRVNVRLSVQQKCPLSRPRWYQMLA